VSVNNCSILSELIVSNPTPETVDLLLDNYENLIHHYVHQFSQSIDCALIEKITMDYLNGAVQLNYIMRKDGTIYTERELDLPKIEVGMGLSIRGLERG
jgi:hypothetical protein